MNRSKHRIVVLTTGILSGLLLLLYTPMLIWSLPWSENGCYQLTEKQKNSIKLEELLIYFNNGHVTCHTSWGTGSMTYPMMFFKDSNSDKWHGIADPAPTIEITNKKMTLIDGNTFNCIKTSNPFTLWHIKWLEWTN